MTPTGNDRLEVRPVDNVQELKEVYRITHDCYVSMAYAPAQPNGLLIHYPEFDVLPETTILIAVQNGEIVGSVSYTTSGREGLSIAHDFQEECRTMEKEGRILAAVWRLVVKETCRSSRQVVIGLISELVRRNLRNKVTTWLMIVNPRHEKVYQRLLNMRVTARKESTGGLSNAPAVLLRCDRETLPAAWRLADFSVETIEPLGLDMLEPLLDLLPDSHGSPPI